MERRLRRSGGIGLTRGDAGDSGPLDEQITAAVQKLVGSTAAQRDGAVAPRSFLEAIIGFEARAEGDKTPDAVGYRAEGRGADFAYVQDTGGIDLSNDRWQQFLAGAPQPPE